MKRWLPFGIFLLLAVASLALCQTAIDPDNFTGEWYSASEQTVYLFQEGLIYYPKHSIPISDTKNISGAYSFTGDTIVLFAAGIDGLKTVQELHLIERGHESMLCEHSDGSGKIYFVRYNDK